MSICNGVLWQANILLDYKKVKKAIVILQAAMRAARLRLHFLRKKKAAIVIQAYTRGWLARDFVKELKAKKKAEEEKKRKAEQEKRDKESREKGEQLMEESFLAAQRELFAMARSAEIKASSAIKAAKDPGAVNLDTMFKFLADGISGDKKTETQVQAKV